MDAAGEIQHNRSDITSSNLPVTSSIDEGYRFNVGTRSVLQNLNPNATLSTSSAPQMNLGSQLAGPLYGGGLNGNHAPFRTSSSFSGYMTGQNTVANSIFNPLCAQSSGSLSYSLYHAPPFAEARRPASSFPAINTRLPFSAYTFAPSPAHLTEDHDTSEFEI